MITPTGDPMTQSLMAGPMIALYILSIGLAWVFGKTPAPRGGVGRGDPQVGRGRDRGPPRRPVRRRRRGARDGRGQAHRDRASARFPTCIVAFDRSPSAAARAAILKVLEATPDRRSAELGAEQLESDGADPAVRAAAVGLLGAYLESPESTRVLDTLTAFILDAERPDALRLHALDAIERALPDVLKPLRAGWLKTRARRSGPGRRPARRPARP